MFGAAKANDGMMYCGDDGQHRFKVHTRNVGALTHYEVEWQRNWREIIPLMLDDPEHPGQQMRCWTNNDWESTSQTFSTKEQAASFAMLVLSGEINAAGEKLGADGAQAVHESQARRTQPYYQPGNDRRSNVDDARSDG